MVAAASWPSSLPQSFEIDGYSISPSENVIREQMEVGPPKTRRRASVSNVAVTAEMKVTDEQRLIFDAYYKGVLFHGTRAFAMRDPSGTLREYFVQKVVYGQGMDIWPYWRVQLQLEYID